MEFMRAVSIILVVMNVYWYCYAAIVDWHLTMGIVDRILTNFDRTAGLFHSRTTGWPRCSSMPTISSAHTSTNRSR